MGGALPGGRRWEQAAPGSSSACRRLPATACPAAPEGTTEADGEGRRKEGARLGGGGGAPACPGRGAKAAGGRGAAPGAGVTLRRWWTSPPGAYCITMYRHWFSAREDGGSAEISRITGAASSSLVGGLRAAVSHEAGVRRAALPGGRRAGQNLTQEAVVVLRAPAAVERGENSGLWGRYSMVRRSSDAQGGAAVRKWDFTSSIAISLSALFASARFTSLRANSRLSAVGRSGCAFSE